jgi:hypothetical protein
MTDRGFRTTFALDRLASEAVARSPRMEGKPIPSRPE